MIRRIISAFLVQTAQSLGFQTKMPVPPHKPEYMAESVWMQPKGNSPLSGLILRYPIYDDE
jgi:hypothetical protein